MVRLERQDASGHVCAGQGPGMGREHPPFTPVLHGLRHGHGRVERERPADHGVGGQHGERLLRRRHREGVPCQDTQGHPPRAPRPHRVPGEVPVREGLPPDGPPAGAQGLHDGEVPEMGRGSGIPPLHVHPEGGLVPAGLRGRYTGERGRGPMGRGREPGRPGGQAGPGAPGPAVGTVDAGRFLC